jgi:hypothetical protein
MERILSQFSGPAYLITVLIMGIIVAVLGNFITKWISRFISVFSNSYKEKQIKKERERQELITALSNDGVLLLHHFIRSFFTCTISVLV